MPNNVQVLYLDHADENPTSLKPYQSSLMLCSMNLADTWQNLLCVSDKLAERRQIVHG